MVAGTVWHAPGLEDGEEDVMTLKLLDGPLGIETDGLGIVVGAGPEPGMHCE